MKRNIIKKLGEALLIEFIAKLLFFILERFFR